MSNFGVRVVQLFPLFTGLTLCYLTLQLFFLYQLNPVFIPVAGTAAFINIFGNIGITWLVTSLIVAVSPESWQVLIRRVVFIALYVGLIGTLICDQYVLITHERLDEAIFLFNWKEVWMIADPAHRINWGSATGIIVLLGLPFLLVNWLKRYTPPYTWLVGTIVLCNLIRFIPIRSDIDRLSDNRFEYFIKRSVIALTNSNEQENANPRDFRELDPAFYGSHKGIHPGYPLAHRFEEPSMLAEQLRRTSHQNPPHIKIIIVESMSSDLFGERGRNTGNLMPFMDSLSKQSIYFPNGFSTYQRTHNVLPAVLASVPNTIDGNVFQQLPFPRHYSLFNLLSKDYHTQFYCGVPLSYLNMVGLMSHYKTDYQVNRWHTKCLAHKERVGSSWGYPDEDLFWQAHYDDSAKFNRSKNPVLKVFLTISSHDPFLYPNKDKWQRNVLEKSQKITDIKLRNMVRRQSASFGSFCYVDSVLQDFFSKEVRNPQFNNTIYIITGDHGTELYRRNALSKYNVPILIYSPLLKKPSTSRAVVSHNDIAPTLINYLKSIYQLKLPDTVAFVGRELNLSSSFKADRKLVFTTNKLRTTDLISDQYAWIGGKPYKIDYQLNLTPMRASKREKWAKKQLQYYQAFTRYTLLQDKLLDSVSYSQWVGKPLVFKIKKKQSIKELNVAPGMTYLESHSLKTKYSTIRIEVDCKMYLNKLSDINNAPNLVLQSRKTYYLSKKWTIFRLVKPRIQGKFKPKERNQVIYSLEFNPKDLAVWKKGGSLHVYMQHSLAFPIRLKEVGIQIYEQEE